MEGYNIIPHNKQLLSRRKKFISWAGKRNKREKDRKRERERGKGKERRGEERRGKERKT